MRAHNFIDMTGKKYGRLTVICPVKKSHKAVVWKCVCECGKEKDIHGPSLRKGLSKSCGCLSAELSSARSSRPDYHRIRAAQVDLLNTACGPE